MAIHDPHFPARQERGQKKRGDRLLHSSFALKERKEERTVLPVPEKEERKKSVPSVQEGKKGKGDSPRPTPDVFGREGEKKGLS